jgi:hypothetical protein
VTNVDAARVAAPSAAVADPERDVAADAEATGAFSRSVLVSGVRCTLAYVVFPWLLPLVGLSGATGPVIGLVIGIVAIGFNIASIRRFQASDHRWKWPITAVNCSVIVLLVILGVTDLGALL